MIRDGDGDLLASGADALVNPVNCVGVMGKGLALAFKQRWPAMFAEYARVCARGELGPGRLHVWETGGEGPRFIVNLPTKRHWRQPSRLEDVDAGLVALAEAVRARGIRSVAVPALGAGLGGLSWADVRPRIVERLGALEDVDVRVWAPGEPRRSVTGRAG